MKMKSSLQFYEIEQKNMDLRAQTVETELFQEEKKANHLQVNWIWTWTREKRMGLRKKG